MKVLRNQHWGRAGFRAQRNELNVCVRPSARNTGALQAGNGRTSLVLALTDADQAVPRTREPVRHNLYGYSGMHRNGRRATLTRLTSTRPAAAPCRCTSP